MTVIAQPTPNPNAMKFTVGGKVGGPVTYRKGEAVEHPLAVAILATEGVDSVFWTADFVTVSKATGGDWATIQPAVESILRSQFETG
ncbi:MAG: NifU N-terminal domain-containing protein [bacterium]|nr:NifU N-terminal domain-containing protein [bacterium]